VKDDFGTFQWRGETIGTVTEEAFVNGKDHYNSKASARETSKNNKGGREGNRVTSDAEELMPLTKAKK